MADEGAAPPLAGPVEPTLSILDLPPDLLRTVLGLLGPADLAAFGSVSQAARAAANDEELWAALAVAGAGVARLGPPPARSGRRPPTAAACADAAVGPLSDWAAAGVTSHKALVLGLLHPYAWATAGLLAVDGVCCHLGGLIRARLQLPGHVAAPRGGLLLGLLAPTALDLGFAVMPLAHIAPGVPPSADQPDGSRPTVACMRTGAPTPGVVPLPGAHAAAFTVAGGPGARSITLTCAGGCDTPLWLTQARVQAVMAVASGQMGAYDGPGTPHGPPARPGLPKEANRMLTLPDLLHTLGGLRLRGGDRRGPEVGRVELVGVPPCAVAGWEAASAATPLPPHPGPRPPPPPPPLPLGARLAGLWKGAYGAHGVEVVALGPPGSHGPRAPGMPPPFSPRIPWAAAALKVAGDANVPAGQFSFWVADMDIRPVADVETIVRGFMLRATEGARVLPDLPDPPTLGAVLRTVAGIVAFGTYDPPGLGAAAGDRLVVTKAHFGHGQVAAPGFETPKAVPAWLLELDGFSTRERVDAFVFCWLGVEEVGDLGANAMASLFVRVAENEVLW